MNDAGYRMFRQQGFMGAIADYETARVVLVGAPMDFTASYLPGSRTGPAGIREVSEVLEEYSLRLGLDLRENRFHDAGDIILPFGNVTESLFRIQEAASRILMDGKFPLFLGGEHLISLPVVQAVACAHKDLAILHLDAHADLRDTYEGQKYSHATAMRRISETVGGRNIFQVGIRSGTREELEYAGSEANVVPGKTQEAVLRVLDSIGDRPVYVTLDIDVVDPAFAPGTGTPEPGGCSSAEILEVIYLLQNANLVGFDLVEVAPVLDYSRKTAILAAKIIREAVLVASKTRLGKKV